MLLVLVDESYILDLMTGTLYEYGSASHTVKVWLRGESNYASSPCGKYADALWTYLKDNLTVKPKE